MVLYDWLLSLSIGVSRFIHVAVDAQITLSQRHPSSFPHLCSKLWGICSWRVKKGSCLHPHSHSTYDFCSGISNGIPNLGATLQSEMRNGAPNSPLSGIPPCVIKFLVGVFNELLTTLDHTISHMNLSHQLPRAQRGGQELRGKPARP